MSEGNWGQMGNYMGGGFMFWIFILIIGFLIFGFFKSNSNDNNNFRPREDNALEILKKRFANSEVSEEEYLDKKKFLEK